MFEVPTGVIADTIGRRASFLIGIASLAVATLGYVGSAVFHWGLPGFILASVVLGFGFTCQTGAVDAWLVDALDATGYAGSKDRVFARNGIFTGISMLTGVLAGGLLGQLSLAIPYLVRTGLLVIAFAVTFAFMHELGFEPRSFRFSRFGEESRKIFGTGITYGWRHPVVRPLLFTSLVNGLLLWYLFYASQPYALDMLGRGNLVWVAGVITALFALSGVAGNSLVGRISRGRLGKRPGLVLAWTSTGMAVCATGLGILGLVTGTGNVAAFAVLVVLLVGFGMLSGILGPVRQAYHQRPYPVRATRYGAVVRLGLLGCRRCRGTGGLGLRGSGRVESRRLHDRRGDLFRGSPALPAGSPSCEQARRPTGAGRWGRNRLAFRAQPLS